MAKERKKTRISSKIDELPPETKRQVDIMSVSYTHLPKILFSL